MAIAGHKELRLRSYSAFEHPVVRRIRDDGQAAATRSNQAVREAAQSLGDLVCSPPELRPAENTCDLFKDETGEVELEASVADECYEQLGNAAKDDCGDDDIRVSDDARGFRNLRAGHDGARPRLPGAESPF